MITLLTKHDATVTLGWQDSRSEINDTLADQSVYFGILEILSKYVLCELKRTKNRLNGPVVLSTHNVSYDRKEKQYYFSQIRYYTNSFQLKLLIAQVKILSN